MEQGGQSGGSKDLIMPYFLNLVFSGTVVCLILHGAYTNRLFIHTEVQYPKKKKKRSAVPIVLTNSSLSVNVTLLPPGK